MNLFRALDPGDQVVAFAAVALLQSTVVVVLARILACGAARRPARRYAIWLAALVGLLLGPIVATAAGRAGLSFVDLPRLRRAASSLATAAAEGPDGDATPPSDSSRPAWMTRLPIDGPGGAETPAGLRPDAATAHGDRPRAAFGLAFAVWAMGATAMTARLVVGGLALSRLRRRARPIDEGSLRDVLADVHAAFGGRALPPILVSDDLDRPVAVCVFRPAVVLPAGLLEAMGPRRLRDVLIHECAHVVRRDLLVGALQRAAEIAYWPQPLIRLLNRELARAREEVCDNHVLRGGDRLAYSRTLLEVAEVAQGPSFYPTTSGLLSSAWRLEDRIAGILDDGRDLMTRTNRRAALLTAAGFLATTATFAGLVPAGDDDKADVSGSVDRLAGKLRQGSLAPATDEEWFGLYMLDLANGASTLITAEPTPGLRNCGSPRWSPDGRRILFDASPAKNWRETRLKSIDLGDDPLKVVDLGLGNCPSFAPDGSRIAFLSNSREPANQPLGIWTMRGDGSERRPMNVYGAPQWSPDGRKLLVVHFGSPVTASLLDVETGVERPLVFPGHRIHPSPRWAGPDTVVAAATSEEGTAIALYDVSNPDDCKVKEILWKKGDRLDADPLYPSFSPAAGRCAFIAKTAAGQALYSVDRGSFGPPRRLEDRGPDRKLAGLEFSPDGRFLLFCSDRPLSAAAVSETP